MYKNKSKNLYKAKYTKEGYRETLEFVFNIWLGYAPYDLKHLTKSWL